MRNLNTRDLCFLARVSTQLRRAVGARPVWVSRHASLFGSALDADAQTLRRACRRSELRAARWLDAECNAAPLGGAAVCAALDETKLACGERDCVRIYCTQGAADEDIGRKLGTLRGHSTDVTCVASSDTLLLSGDAGGSLRLWAVDDFKPVRTLRGHAGNVADCLLLRDGPPVSASSDGTVKIWDANAPAAIATLEFDTAITSLATDAAAAGCPASLYAGGGFIECVDIASATRTLTLVDLLDDNCEAGVLPVSRLSVHGSLLAAGGDGVVSLWDVRAARLVACLQAGSGACGGLQIDDWKLVAAFAADDCVVVHDIRAVSSTGRFSTSEPLLSLPTDGRVTALRFCGSVLLAAVEGRPCVSWSFDAPSSAAQAGADSPDADAGRAERRKKMGVPKVRGRYAKRTTR
jgi:WD40 repeat protein